MREFYRSNYGGLDGPTRTLMYAITCDGDVVGMIRMARRDEADTMETGMWVGQSARGQGIGVAALRLLLAEAARAGSRRVVAETTYKNTAALGVLRRCGAVLRDDGTGGSRRDPTRPGLTGSAGISQDSRCNCAVLKSSGLGFADPPMDPYLEQDLAPCPIAPPQVGRMVARRLGKPRQLKLLGD